MKDISKSKKLMAPAAAAMVLLTLAAPGALLLPHAAHAQLFGDDDDKDNPNQPPTNNTAWDAKKLQQLDRDVRKLERSVARVENKQAPPILIEPDPEVVALQATVDSLSRKLDDNANTITHLTGQLEDAQHQNQLLQQQALNGTMQKQVDNTTKSLQGQVSQLKTQIGDKTDADMATAYSNLQQAQVAVQASAHVLSNLSQYSLLNYLK